MTKEPRWQTLKIAIDQNTRDTLDRRYGLLADTISWFKAIQLFRDAEHARMIERDPSPADRQQHKTWLASLIADGERLVTAIRTKGGLDKNEAGIRLSDVQAAVEELNSTMLQWHGGMTRERKAELWERVFNAKKSRD